MLKNGPAKTGATGPVPPALLYKDKSIRICVDLSSCLTLVILNEIVIQQTLSSAHVKEREREREREREIGGGGGGGSLVNQTLFRSAGCIVDHQHTERGSGNSGRYSASPAGMSAEAMALLWSHDIEVVVHKNVINNYLYMRTRVYALLFSSEKVVSASSYHVRTSRCSDWKFSGKTWFLRAQTQAE